MHIYGWPIISKVASSDWKDRRSIPTKEGRKEARFEVKSQGYVSGSKKDDFCHIYKGESSKTHMGVKSDKERMNLVTCKLLVLIPGSKRCPNKIKVVNSRFSTTLAVEVDPSPIFVAWKVGEKGAWYSENQDRDVETLVKEMRLVLARREKVGGISQAKDKGKKVYVRKKASVMCNLKAKLVLEKRKLGVQKVDLGSLKVDNGPILKYFQLDSYTDSSREERSSGRVSGLDGDKPNSKACGCNPNNNSGLDAGEKANDESRGKGHTKSVLRLNSASKEKDSQSLNMCLEGVNVSEAFDCQYSEEDEGRQAFLPEPSTKKKGRSQYFSAKRHGIRTRSLQISFELYSYSQRYI
ncbi:hypothetical protein Q3G72_026739 [Acer saccharum]|nr:hypothetical protein Q3G72_026739 [Acer saccharum]